MTRTWREKGGEENRDCDGRNTSRDIIKSDRRMENKRATGRFNWRVLIENVMREKRGKT